MDKPIIEADPNATISALLDETLKQYNDAYDLVWKGEEMVVIANIQAFLDLHRHIKVAIIKPKWMPTRLFKWLLKSTVIATGDHVNDKLQPGITPEQAAKN